LVKSNSSQEQDEKGLFTLMVSGMPVHTLPNNSYVVNKIQIKMLDEKGIEYNKVD
jgi:hypothetical protein